MPKKKPPPKKQLPDPLFPDKRAALIEEMAQRIEKDRGEMPEHRRKDEDRILFARIKLNKWEKILKRDDLTNKEKDEIREKLGAVLDIMYAGDAHGAQRQPDETVSEIYYFYLEIIQKLREIYTDLDGNMAEFVKHPDVQALIDDLPWDDSFESIREKAEYIVGIRAHPYQLAEEFTGQVTAYSEDRIRKKIKKIYKNT